MKKIKQNHRIAIASAIEAGFAIMEVFHSDEIGMELKEDNSPVTKADLIATQIISSYLNPTNIPTIGEEEQNKEYEIRKNWDEVWIVDPLDGTKEFVKKTKEFTVNVGLVKNQKPVFGVIYVPFTQEVFFGGKEFGSFSFVYKKEIALQDQIDEAVLLPICQINLSKPRITGGRKTDLKFFEEIELTKHIDFTTCEFIRLSSSLKFCRIAEGKMDIYPRNYPCMEWDTVAGHAIVNGVGKEIYDIETSNVLIYNKENLYNPYFILM